MPERSSVPKKPTHRLEEYPPETGSDKLYVGTEYLSGNGPSPVEGEALCRESLQRDVGLASRILVFC